MAGRPAKRETLEQEIERLRTRLEEAEQVIHGIRAGEVDALVVGDHGAEKIYTLQGADQPYRILVEAMSEGAVTLGSGRAILYCNARFAELVKTPPEQVTGQPLEQFVEPAGRKTLAALIEESRKSKRSGEFNLRAADKTLVPVQFSLVPLKLPAGRAVCVVATDLRAVVAAREARLRLASIVDSSQDAIIATAPDGTILSWNPGAERMLGFTAGEAIGRPLAILSPSESDQKAGAPKKMSRKRRETAVQTETVYVRKDGARLNVSLSAFPVSDGFGQVAGTARIVRDITARKRAEEEIRQFSRRLIQVQEEERQRLARELHDSTTQALAAIAIQLDLIKSGSQLNPVARQALDSARDMASRCSEEVRNISQLLHPPLLRELGLSAALESLVEGFNRRTGVAVDLKVAPKFERLTNEMETALFRIAQESLNNVFRHSGSKRAKVRLARKPSEISLRVMDEGKGIATRSARRDGGGPARVGLGIPGMRERVRQLGGRMEIASGGKGTSVSVILPLPQSL